MANKNTLAWDGCPSEALIDALVGGRLSDIQRRRVHEHAAGCGGCRELIAALVRDSQQLSGDRGA